MTRAYSDLKSMHADSQRRDTRGPRHTKTGGHDFMMRADSRAAIEGRTRYPHMVKTGDQMPLKSGHNNTKIGSTVMKGKWRGMPIYTLTLQERDTCPRSCQQWLSCFGNRMNFAQRHEVGPELEDALERQLLALELMNPAGYVVRLHVLGDFYSVHYALLWRKWLDDFTALHVFGYTAWAPDTAIGEAVYATMTNYQNRFAMRWSNQPWQRDNTVSIDRAEDAPPGVVVCPAQTGGSSCCATCGFCWNSRRTVGFINH